MRESLQERMSLFGLTALQLSEESQHDNDDNEAEAVEEENVVVTVNNDALSRTTPNNTSATIEPPSVLSKEPKALSQAFDLSKKARKKRRAESDNKRNCILSFFCFCFISIVYTRISNVILFFLFISKQKTENQEKENFKQTQICT